MAHRQDFLEGDALLHGLELGSTQRWCQYTHSRCNQTDSDNSIVPAASPR
jgi:hypothetical protein